MCVCGGGGGGGQHTIIIASIRDRLYGYTNKIIDEMSYQLHGYFNVMVMVRTCPVSDYQSYLLPDFLTKLHL